MGRSTTILVGLLLFAVLASLCLRSRPPAIQAAVLACAQERLAAAELPDLLVEADGRDLHLTGSVFEEGSAARAEEAVEDGCGARRVANDLTVVTGPYRTTMCVQGDGVRISGTVPTADDRSAAPALVEERVGSVPVSADLSVRPGAPEGYRRTMDQALSDLSQLDEGCIDLEGNQLRVSGAIRSQDALDRLTADLEAAALDDFEVNVDVSVPDLSAEALACRDAYAEMLGPGAHVLFDFDSTELHDEGRALLDTAEEIWEQECPNVSVIVTGHTDDVGESVYNQELSLQRAQSVVDYLVTQGIPADMLTAIGYGEAQPRVSNDTEEGRAMNRRIEFRLREPAQ